MNTLVVGLGNPILGDDGVGWKVVEEIKKQLTSPSTSFLPGGWNQIEVDCVSLGGIGLMERLIGYDRAILIDAFAIEDMVGSISVLSLDKLPNYSAYHTTSIHDTSLQNAIELGREMGACLPEDVTIVGIATRRVYDFSQELSPLVAQAVPRAAQLVLDLIKETVII